MNSESLRNNITTLIKKILRNSFQTLFIGDNFYIQPKDCSTINNLISNKILSDSIILSNKLIVKPETKTITELSQSLSDIIEKPNEGMENDFDEQVIAHLKKVRLVPREQPPKEFFTPYSDPKLCITMLFLYLFLILVIKTSGDLYMH